MTANAVWVARQFSATKHPLGCESLPRRFDRAGKPYPARSRLEAHLANSMPPWTFLEHYEWCSIALAIFDTRCGFARCIPKPKILKALPGISRRPYIEIGIVCVVGNCLHCSDPKSYATKPRQKSIPKWQGSLQSISSPSDTKKVHSHDRYARKRSMGILLRNRKLVRGPESRGQHYCWLTYRWNAPDRDRSSW